MIREGKARGHRGATDVPWRIFRCGGEEVDALKASGTIASGLDKAGFVHLSDKTSAPSSLACSSRFNGPSADRNGRLAPRGRSTGGRQMGDAQPDDAARSRAAALPHDHPRLKPDGCVHVYGTELGVPMSAVVRTQRCRWGRRGPRFPRVGRGREKGEL